MSIENQEEDMAFNWSDEGVVAVKPIRGIAIYSNPTGEVVVRQENDGDFWPIDPFIIIPRDKVRDVIRALQREIEE